MDVGGGHHSMPANSLQAADGRNGVKVVQLTSPESQPTSTVSRPAPARTDVMHRRARRCRSRAPDRDRAVGRETGVADRDFRKARQALYPAPRWQLFLNRCGCRSR